MDYLLIAVVAFGASLLTLYSGFGLGTLLLPAFALFAPLPVAIAATALVHLANNLFKIGLIGRHAVWRVVWRFGLAAAVASALGALLLNQAAGWPVWGRYVLGGTTRLVQPVGVLVGTLMVVFALLELWPRFARLSFPASALPLGGALSGFIGGLSGHQGALRAAFLARCGLTKEQFIGTGALCAVIVDLARLLVYGAAAWRDHFQRLQDAGGGRLVLLGIGAAFLGSYLGARLMGKVTLAGVQRLVALMLIVLGLALGAGLL